MFTGYIYKHTAPNGKGYVGATLDTVAQRASYGYTGKAMREAIDEFGWNNFKHEVLEEITADDQHELVKLLNAKERFYIYEENTLIPNGYNSTKGGYSFSALGKAYDITKEDLQIYYTDMHLTTEQIADIFGCGRQTISNRLKEYNIPIQTTIRRVGMNDIYPMIQADKTIAEATKALGISHQTLQRRCKSSTGYTYTALRKLPMSELLKIMEECNG